MEEFNKLITAIAAATIWYLLIILVKVVLAIGYNHILNKDRFRLVPVCLKVVAGATATEILRVIRALPFMIITAWYIVDHFGISSRLVITMIVGLIISAWAADSITAYGAMGIPLIVGDFVRWARATGTAETVEASQALLGEIKQLIKEAKSNGATAEN